MSARSQTSWGEQVRKLARDGVRNGHAVNPELEIRVVLPDVDLFEASVGGAGNGEQEHPAGPDYYPVAAIQCLSG